MALKSVFIVVYDFICIIRTLKLREKIYFPYSMTVNGNLGLPDELSDFNDTQEV